MCKPCFTPSWAICAVFSWALDCLDEDLAKDFLSGWLAGRISRSSVNTPSGIQLTEWRCSSTAVSNSGSGPIPTSEHYPLSWKAKEEFFWARRNLNIVKYIRICLTIRINISHISSAPCIGPGLEKAPAVFLGFSGGNSSFWKVLGCEIPQRWVGGCDASRVTCMLFTIYQGRSKEVKDTPGGGRTGFRVSCFVTGFL